jgi:hypothetical protein
VITGHAHKRRVLTAGRGAAPFPIVAFYLDFILGRSIGKRDSVFDLRIKASKTFLGLG